MPEQTFAMVKPDAVADHNTGRILTLIEDAPFRIRYLRMHAFTKDAAIAFYWEHKAQPFFDALVAFTCSGPVVLMILEGADAVSRWRKLMGSTNPLNAEPHTLRRRFGQGMPNNAVHGSDSVESAAREIALIQEITNG